METKNFKKLIQKYQAGDTNLKEEQSLFDNSEKSASSIEPWSSFVTGNKRKVPENLNETLWISFQNRTNRKQKLRIAVLSAAASLILMFTLLTSNPEQEKLSNREKEALLEQAIKMIEYSEQVTTEDDIIYEDEMIIIYMSTEL